MGQVIGISNTHIRAVEGAEIPTLKVSGTVGVDFQGGDLADYAISMAADTGEARIILESFGGSAFAAFSFYDTILTSGTKIHVDGRGVVASAATIIMAAAGRKRSRLYPNAEYLPHNASGDDPDAVERANVKMQTIYMGLTGMSRPEIKALMAKDKLISAQEAKRMGFVGAVVDHMKLAAHADNNQPMSETTTKVKRVFAVSRALALQALVDGNIEIEVSAEDAQLKTELDSAVSDLKAEQKKTADLEASALTTADTIKAEVKKAEDALTTKHTGELKALSDKLDAKDKEIEALKKAPAAPAVKPVTATKTEEVDNTPLAEKYPKITAEERHSDLDRMLAEKRAKRLKVA